jgi:hypothetical protein
MEHTEDDNDGDDCYFDQRPSRLRAGRGPIEPVSARFLDELAMILDFARRLTLARFMHSREKRRTEGPPKAQRRGPHRRWRGFTAGAQLILAARQWHCARRQFVDHAQGKIAEIGAASFASGHSSASHTDASNAIAVTPTAIMKRESFTMAANCSQRPFADLGPSLVRDPSAWTWFRIGL